MALQTTIGKLLIDQALPADMRGKVQELDKKGIQALFQHIADNKPEQYREIAQNLMKASSEAGYASGGYSFGLKHLLPARSAVIIRQQLDAKVERILADPTLSDTDKEQQIILHSGRAAEHMEKEIYDESLAEGNPLAMQIKSGAKGNKTNLRSLRGGDLLYLDHHDHEVPIPVTKSYAEGLEPAQYFAGTFGARKGLVDLKVGTADAGYLSKQLGQAAHRLVVTAHDSDKPHDHNNPIGMPTTTDDADNEGAFLAKAAGPYPRNTRLTPKILADLRERNIKDMLVRSPIAGGPADGGVYGLDVGVRERGDVAPVGDFVGIGAAQSVGEPLSQATIGSKHSGGVAGGTASASGFKLIDQLVQHPSSFAGGAAHSQLDGTVNKIEAAPQGGHYITVDSHQHYAPTGTNPTAKLGDKVEAGDALSNGIHNPAELVMHKGIGEGRKLFADQLREAAAESGFKLHRRNLELLSRALINHVRIGEEMGDYVPGDVIPYQTLEHGYEPRNGYQEVTPKQAIGKYLEKPVLHYSIGTQIKPSVHKVLEHHGITNVTVHNEPPPFEPVMIRGQSNLSADTDWMTRLLGSNLEKNLLRGAHRAETSDELGTSYVPSLAKGLGFGVLGKTKGWDPKTLKVS